MNEAQVISFTIHNPAAPNVRCSVLHRHDDRCKHDAVWAVVREDGSNYRMTAYCAEHWFMLGSPGNPVER